ncbi:hypothetical protein ABH926_002621 [Catenulispora sp. GP43]|uniref:phosphoribosyltransferase n=1 Tax=Catenulispora sp. GP43 TaxID=3156263 RepID=UPI0035157D53
MGRTVIPAYFPDSRANKLLDYQVWEVTGNATPDNWLYLKGSNEVARQFEVLNGNSCYSIKDRQMRSGNWSHGYHFPQGMNFKNNRMANLLKEVLTMTLVRNASIDCAIAFDWYKIPPEAGTQSEKWDNTETGELVHRGKYYKGVSRAKEMARAALSEKYLLFVQRHPLYAQCETIITVPGHNADGASFGETMAQEVADLADKELVLTKSLHGPRPQAKSGSESPSAEQFHIPISLAGDVIILDDVYKSGGTMNAVAEAAKRAGASRVFGVAAVRTMKRN